MNWRHTDFTPSPQSRGDKDKHVCNGVNLILHLASIAARLTHAVGEKKKKNIPNWLIPQQLFPYLPLSVSLWHAAAPSRSADFYFFYFPNTGTSRGSAYVARNVANTRASLPPGSERSTRRQIVMLECATEPYNPHLLGQAADERGNDGGMETLRGRRGGRMMEWLLNIQQAVKSMQGVVGRLHYGGASVLHLFISSLFSILVPRLLSSVSSVPLVFFLSLFPDIFSSSRFLPFFSCPHFFCVHNIFPLRSFFFIFHVFL